MGRQRGRASGPPDSPEEIATVGRNQHLSAERGREPGLRLERGGREITLLEWADEILWQCGAVAEALDAAQGGRAYRDALAAARRAIAEPASLPWADEQQAAFAAMALVSHRRREAIEDADRVDFETWRRAYLDPATLVA